jgi:hypothetical protein
MGSIYLLLAAEIRAEKQEGNATDTHHTLHTHHCTTCMHDNRDQGDDDRRPTLVIEPNSDDSRSSTDMRSPTDEDQPRAYRSRTVPEMEEVTTHTSTSPSGITRMATSTHPGHPGLSVTRTTSTVRDAGGRRKIASALTNIGHVFGNAAHKWFDDSGFESSGYVEFPEIPGESFRNDKLDQIKRQFRGTSISGVRSRAGSSVSVHYSGMTGDGPTDRLGISRVQTTPYSSPSPPQGAFAAGPSTRRSVEFLDPDGYSPSSAGPPLSPRIRPPWRAATLQVPPQSYQNPGRGSP